MPLKILIIHESGLLGKILKNTILNEVNNASVDMVSSLEEISQMFQKIKYDVVISQQEMKEIKGVDVRNFMVSDKINRNTPFIIMTSSYETMHKELKYNGIQYILPLPFSPFQLRDIISRAANLGVHRTHKRYEIPQTKVTLNIEENIFSADIINFSMGGFLCGFIYPEKFISINFLRAAKVDVLFPTGYNTDPVRQITSLPIRIRIETYRKNLFPEKVNFAYQFIDISKEVLSTFVKVLGVGTNTR